MAESPKGYVERSKKPPAGKDKPGTDLDTAKSELQYEIEDAVNFVSAEFQEEWARAERYFDGQTDLKAVKNRSTVVKTEVRDAIRALKPSVMRTLLHARQIVEYEPNSVETAEFAAQQGAYITQLFWANGGYNLIYSAIDEAMKKKIGPIKTYWEEDPIPEFTKMTDVPEEVLLQIQQAEDCEILKIEETEENDNPVGGIPTFEVEYVKYYMNGRIRMEAFPAHEFFISRNADNQDDAFVHGHRRDVTVGEAMNMGLEHDDWVSLDADDPDTNEFAEESSARRGYTKDRADDTVSDDLLNKKFLLTEAYCEYDLEGTGKQQKYVFWFGGTSYTYLDHQRISDWEIDITAVDPVPFTLYGRSIFDLTANEQDTMTSLLRATVDNAHMANNPRFAANPMTTDFKDLMNDGIGAPIKTRVPGDIQVVDIPFTGLGMLPLLQYLEQDTENKVGVTKAAQGLDPNAMQSTDKQAVQNTIALSQGQVELIVRNIIETALIPVFRRLLRLSVHHMDRMQVMRVSGTIIPIDTYFFDPDLIAVPKVGLGTASPEQKMQALQFVMGKQEEILGNFGLDNPFTSLSQLYNTLEDIVELSGLYNVGRYFKVVTPQIEQQLAKQQAEAAEKAKKEGGDQAPVDPSKALMMIEAGKARVDQMKIAADVAAKENALQLEAITSQERLDIERDKMAQDKVIKLAAIQEDGRRARADTAIRREQNANNKDKMRLDRMKEEENDIKPEVMPNEG